MRAAHRPVRTTIVLGACAAAIWILAGGAIDGRHWKWPWMTFGITWGMITFYAVLMARWSRRRVIAVFMPLLMLGAVGLTTTRTGVIFFWALAVFSWIRSGICFPGPMLPSFLRELILCGGGGLVIALWGPQSPVSWGLGFWFFTLIQALFFILGETGPVIPEDPDPDPFDLARRRIEALLDD